MMTPDKFDAASLAQLAGSYRVMLGQSPSLVGARPLVQGNKLGLVLRGHDMMGAQKILGSLFTLCAHAHVFCTQLIQSAVTSNADQVASTQAHEQLCQNTALDHLRALCLDWPARLPMLPLPSKLSQLATWPLTNFSWQALGQWLLRDVQLSAELEPRIDAQLKQLGLLEQQALSPLNPHDCLNVLHTDPALQRERLLNVAQQFASDTAWRARPTWQARASETGSWTRLRDQATMPTETNTDTETEPALLRRLLSRWRELEYLAAWATQSQENKDKARLLSAGAVVAPSMDDDRCVLSWCEMARGLLMHWARLNANGRIVDYAVLAPTDWNFHPQGNLANSLSAWQSQGNDAMQEKIWAQIAMAAYDPCVECEVVVSSPNASNADLSPAELSHA